MEPPKNILTISRNQPLQQTRTFLLEKAGYAVIALGENDATVYDFLDSADQPTLSLILLCHSVPEPSRVQICVSLKTRHPNTPILMLYNGYDPTAADVDGRLENLHSPKALVDTIQLLVAQKPPKAASGGS